MTKVANKTIKSEYSLMSVFGILPTGTNPLAPDAEIPINIGGCFPKNCSAPDIESILAEAYSNIEPKTNLTLTFSVRIDDVIHWRVKDYIFVSLMALKLLWIGVITAIDLSSKSSVLENSKLRFLSLRNALSIFQIRSKSPSVLKSLDGIRGIIKQ